MATEVAAVLACVLASVAFVAVGPQGPGDDPTTNLLPHGKEAILLLDPIRVASEGNVLRACWSPSGDHVLLVRQDPKITRTALERALSGDRSSPPVPETTLVLWSKASGKSHDLLKLLGEDTVAIEGWLPSTDRAILGVIRRQRDPGLSAASAVDRAFYELDAASRRLSLIVRSEALPAEGPSTAVWLSPREPVAALVETRVRHDASTRTEARAGARPSVQTTIQAYYPGGRLGPKFPMPPITTVFGWTPDGKGLVFRNRRIGGRSGDPARSFSVLDLANGRQSPFAGDPFAASRSLPAAEVALDPPTFEAHFGYTRPAPRSQAPTWLTSRNEPSGARLLLTSEAEFAELSPKLDAVLYVTRGVAMVRSFAKVPKAWYEEAVKSAKRAMAISRGKQVALAAIMYATDHGESLPGSADDWQKMLHPYLKNESMFEGFEYTFPGGLLRDINAPADTELGFIQLEAGRVVAYADGHVKFVSDRQEPGLRSLLPCFAYAGGTCRRLSQPAAELVDKHRAQIGQRGHV